MVKTIQINLSNKMFYTLIAIGILITSTWVIFAYNSGGPPNAIGHSAEELDLSGGVNGNAVFNNDVSVNGNVIALGTICDSGGTNCIGTGGFPVPDYDSGWISLSPAQTQFLTHNLGGNRDNYLVDFQCSTTTGPHIYYHGIDGYPGFGELGAAWSRLDSTQIRVQRGQQDTYCPQVRVRIWTY